MPYPFILSPQLYPDLQLAPLTFRGLSRIGFQFPLFTLRVFLLLLPSHSLFHLFHLPYTRFLAKYFVVYFSLTMLKTFLTTTQIVASITLIVLILMQARGTGFGRTGGGSGASFTRRGLEMLIFKLTFFVVAIFLIVSLSLLFV